MSAIPASQHATARRIFKLHEERRGAARSYLGASELGYSCSRRLWLSFRHAEAPKFEGRILRLFETGNVEEHRIIDELRGIGVRVEGTQSEVVRFGGHFKGHCDGVGLGFDEAPKAWHLLEIKTHNARSFADVAKKGVAESKPMHYAQMQVYMGELELDRGMYIAVNKDDDDIYCERIAYDEKKHVQLMDRAGSVIFAAEPPQRISNDAAYYECKFCPFHVQCHVDTLPLVHCRTCAHATPEMDGTWHCAHWQSPIPPENVEEGCDEHRYIPAVVERVLDLAEVGDNNVVVWKNKTNSASVRQPDYRSTELRAAADKKFIGDEWLQSMKGTFPGARVSGPDPAPTMTVAADDIQSDLPWETA